jgi:hypothetical protein
MAWCHGILLLLLLPLLLLLLLLRARLNCCGHKEATT